MIRLAHFSDLHYAGATLTEVDRCFSFAVDQAIARGVDCAVISGDSTDHALEVHAPAVEALARNIRLLADHCPVLMLHGTFSHEPPGALNVFRLLGGRFRIHVADRLQQVALDQDGRWLESEGWRFDQMPPGARALFSCVPTVNKAIVAAAVGAAEAAEAVGERLTALLRGFAPINEVAGAAGVRHAALVGHSMGSLIALEAAGRAPARASRLAMVGTAYPMKVSDALLTTSRDDPLRAIDMVNAFSHSGLAAKPSYPGPGSWLHGGDRALMRRVLAGQPAVNLFHHDFSVCNAYVGGLQAAALVRCPVHLVLGERDQMTARRQAAEIAQALRATVHTVSAGHALMAEAPDPVLAALRAAVR